MSKKKKGKKKPDPTLAELLTPSGYRAVHPGDRVVDLLNEDAVPTRITCQEYEQLSDYLWEYHTGDDSCGCLRYAFCNLFAGDQRLALEGLRNCIAEHDSGKKLRDHQEKRLHNVLDALDGLG